MKQIADALAREDFDGAVHAAVEAWRACRAPELADLVFALTAWLRPGIPAPADTGDAWLERAGHRRSIDVDVLLAGLTAPPKSMIPRRIDALLGFGPDPRIGAAFLAMVEQPPFTASSQFSAWTKLFAALPGMVDDTVDSRLEASLVLGTGSQFFTKKLPAWIAKCRAALQPPGVLSDRERDDVAALMALVADLGPPPTIDVPVTPVHEPLQAAHLRPALEHLQAGLLPDAIDQLVAFWAGNRGADVAVAIELASTAVTDAGPAGKGKALHQAWLDASPPLPRHVPGMLARLRDGKLADVAERIETMTTWTPDPRVAQALIALTMDYMIGARKRLWDAVYRAILHHADPRRIDEVLAEIDRRTARFGDRSRAIASAGRKVRADLEAHPGPAELDDVDRIDLRAIEALLAERTRAPEPDEAEAALLDAILAAPDDDGPRLVYADWLQANHPDDPRGLFIVLDIQLANGKRVRGKRDKHLKANKAAMLGPLASLGDFAWERGFPVGKQLRTGRGQLELSGPDLEAMLNDSRWRTVQWLSCWTWDHVGLFLARCPLHSLEKVGRITLADLAAIGDRTDPLPLRSVAITWGTDDDGDEVYAGLVRAMDKLPQLTEMAVMRWRRGGPAGRETPPPSFFSSPLVHRMQRLVCGDDGAGGISRVHEWVDAMQAGGCHGPAVVLNSRMLTAHLTPVDGGWTAELKIDWIRYPRDLTELVADFPRLPSALTSVTVHYGDNVDASQREALEAHLAEIGAR